MAHIMALTTTKSRSSSETAISEAFQLNGSAPEHSHYSITSSSSSVTLTNTSWVPRGRLSALILQPFGAGALELVTRIKIKKRFSAISSQIDILPQEDKLWSKGDAARTQVAYRDLVELSSGRYDDRFTQKAIFLRLEILRAIIRNQNLWLESGPYHQTFHDVWIELETLQSIVHEPERQAGIQLLRLMLADKVVDELSSWQKEPWLRVKSLAGTNFITVLCQDLAYGNGGHGVQSAFACISWSSWGREQLLQIAQESPVVLNAFERLLVDFDNTYSRAMAFRIFGYLSTSSSPTTSLAALDSIRLLLSGPSGIGKLIRDLSALAAGEGRFGTRAIESLCDALSSACDANFVHDIVQQGACATLTTLLGTFVQRDHIVQRLVEEEHHDDPDMERCQVSTTRLILNILEEKQGKHALLEAGVRDQLSKFCSHTNRDFSERNLRVIIGQALQGFND